MRRILATVGLLCVTLVPAFGTAQNAGADTDPSPPAPGSFVGSEGPPAPILSDTARAYVEPPIREDVDVDGLGECLTRISAESDVLANYYGYLFSTSRQPPLADVSVNGYGERVWQTWQSDGVVDPQRGIFLMMDVDNTGVGVWIGERWKQADFFDTYVASSMDFVGNDPVERVCERARRIDDKLGGILEDDVLRSRLDVHARLNLTDTRADKVVAEADALTSKARNLSSPDAPLAKEVENRLDLTATREFLNARLQVVRRFVDRDSELTRGEVHEHLKSLDRKLDKLRSHIDSAQTPLRHFRVVENDVRAYRADLEDLRNLVDARTQNDFIWLGADEAHQAAETCEAHLDDARQKLDAGQLVDPSATQGVPACLDRLEATIRATDPLNFFVARVFPTLAAVVFLSSISFLGWRKVKTTREREFETAQLLEEWDQTLEMAEMRMRSLKSDYRAFLEDGTAPADVDRETLEAVLKAVELADALRARHTDAGDLLDGAGRFSFQAIGRADALLNDKPVSIHAEAGDIEVDYTAPPNDALEELETCVESIRGTARDVG